MNKKKQTEADDVSVEQKLQALFTLQQINSQIDKIKIVRGELPLEVQDLEDEIAGLETRAANFEQEVADLNETINARKAAIKESESMIAKYKEQQMKVRNNREFDSLTKELDYQTLEIQLSEKKINDARFKIENLETEIANTKEQLKERNIDLKAKKAELTDIVKDTENEEEALAKRSLENEKYIEDRLLTAYKRIRENARNGLAVVQVERDACGGCFNKIPPQHQLDIRMHKKIIVCDYCGRILVDKDVADTVHEQFK
ncbi:MAG: C4-type zinc ribbon domain-containing protein [Bacteroidales bacterium]|nr:C4-type zinc ribbon domain-containing protein [Bacteroidales bacterium]